MANQMNYEIIRNSGEFQLSLNGVLMKKDDLFNYNIGDNRGTLCKFVDFYYSANMDLSLNITGYILRAILAYRYYDDEQRWSTGIIRIDPTFLKFITLAKPME